MPNHFSKTCTLLLAISFSSPLAAQAMPVRTATMPQTAARALERVRNSPLELRAFLEKMPKGADLHSHLSGAVYAETLIRDAAEDQLCVDTGTISLVPNNGTTRSIPPRPVCSATSEPVADAFQKPDLYASLIDAFSMGEDSFLLTTTVMESY